ncbi:ROK family protein [Spartobacteria bacterium LR76]|nr:ROK family protein [Spartobacteria bacterium LR76]
MTISPSDLRPVEDSPTHRGDYVVGIDMGGTAIKAAAFSPDGQKLAWRTGPTGDGEKIGGDHAWAWRVRELIRELEAEFRRPPLHVGLSSPGLASPDQRCIVSLPNRLHGIEGFDWSEWLGCRVPVLNDAHSALGGEAWQGAARGRRHVVMLTLGTGVGGAAMVDGHILRGHLGRAGHLGHVSVDCSSPEVSIFGMPGALETAIGNYNVPLRSGGRFPDSRALVEAVTQGDEAAAAVWERSVWALGCAIGSFINAFDPEVVVVGGGVAEAGPVLWEPLKRVLAQVEWRPVGSGVPIIPAELGGWAGAWGAAAEALACSER